MKLLAIASLAVLSTTAAHAFDYKISLEGRADFVNGEFETTAANGTSKTEKYNNFSNGLIRLNMLGNINENLTYRFRYRFISSAANPVTRSTSSSGTAASATTTSDAREQSGTAVDYLYIDHKNEYFTTRFGKQNWVDAAGRETYLSGTDVFLATAAAQGYKSGFGSDYRFGVSFIGKIAETNIVTLAISNPNQTLTDASAAGTERKNTGLAMGAYYNGTFFEKLFQPTLGYTTSKQNGDTDALATANFSQDADYSIWNAGLRSEFAGFTVDADYKVFEKDDSIRGAGTNADKTKSIYAMVSYAAGQFTPIAYYVNDKYTTETTAPTADFKRSAFAVGTFWKPFADVNFRYHLMYSNDKKEYENATATNKEIQDNRFWLGFKIDV
jgi:hypothetical protein